MSSPLAAVFPLLGRSNREVGHRLAAPAETHLRVTAQVAHHDNAIHAAHATPVCRSTMERSCFHLFTPSQKKSEAVRLTCATLRGMYCAPQGTHAGRQTERRMNTSDLQIVFRNHAGAWVGSVTLEDSTEATAAASAQWAGWRRLPLHYCGNHIRPAHAPEPEHSHRNLRSELRP